MSIRQIIALNEDSSNLEALQDGDSLAVRDILNINDASGSPTVEVADNGSGVHISSRGTNEDLVVNANGTGSTTIEGVAFYNGVVSGATSLTLDLGATINEFSIDGTMAGNSDTAMPTEKAVVTYVAAQITAEDLDIAGDTGTGAVDLDSQSLTIAGTTDQVVTVASNQTVTLSLPQSIATSSSPTFAALTLGGDLIASKFINHGSAVSTTISTGTIACVGSYYIVTPQGGAVDDLATATGGAEGDELYLYGDGTFAVTVKDGTGANTFILAGGADFILDSVNDRLYCIHNGTEWVEVSRSSNG